MPAATETADPLLEPPGDRSGVEGVAGGAERRVLPGGAERELVQVALADDDRAGRPEPRYYRRVSDRRGTARNPGGGGGRRAGEVDDVLDGHRHAVQGAAIPARGDLPRRRVGLGPGCVVQHDGEGVEGLVAGADAFEGGVDHLSDRRLAGPDRGREPVQRLVAPRCRHGSSRLLDGGAGGTASRFQDAPRSRRVASASAARRGTNSCRCRRLASSAA